SGQSGQQASAPLVGREYRRRVLVRDRKAEHLSNERHRFAKLETRESQVTLELRDALQGPFVASPTQALVENLSDSVKLCVLGQRAPGRLAPHRWLVPDADAELVDQPRLSDSGFANH